MATRTNLPEIILGGAAYIIANSPQGDISVAETGDRDTSIEIDVTNGNILVDIVRHELVLSSISLPLNDPSTQDRIADWLETIGLWTRPQPEPSSLS